MSKRTAASLLALAASLAWQGAGAAYHSFTERGLFDAKLVALGLAPVLHTFDSETAGPILAGQPYDGITFTTWLLTHGSSTFMISGEDVPPTLTPPNQIGTDDPTLDYQMANGSTFSFSIPAGRALGLYVQSADIIYDTDFALTFGSESVGVDPDSGIPVNSGSPTTYAYFLGIIDDAGVHDSGSLTSDELGGALGFWFSADDFVTAAAPAPATIALVGLGLGLIGIRAARSRRIAGAV